MITTKFDILNVLAKPVVAFSNYELIKQPHVWVLEVTAGFRLGVANNKTLSKVQNCYLMFAGSDGMKFRLRSPYLFMEILRCTWASLMSLFSLVLVVGLLCHVSTHSSLCCQHQSCDFLLRSFPKWWITIPFEPVMSLSSFLHWSSAQFDLCLILQTSAFGADAVICRFQSDLYWKLLRQWWHYFVRNT